MSLDTKPEVGRRLRTFRDRHGWSLRTLADRCGLSINAISRIERGENSPTVSSLFRLADALSVPITDFFVEKRNHKAILIPNGTGTRVQNIGFIVERLGNGLSGQQMESFLFTIQPNNGSVTAPISHPGEEFIYCLEGEIEYCVNGQRYSMETGDSLLFEAMLPHFWQNPKLSQATVLIIFQASQDNSLARQYHQTG